MAVAYNVRNRENPLKKLYRDLIGRVTHSRTVNMFSYFFNTRDWSRADYAYWDQVRRCKKRGFEVSGLFFRPLGSRTTEWVLGRAPTWVIEEDADTQKVINEWWELNHSDIMRVCNEAVDLGDCFLVINPDLTITVVPPHVVTPIVSETDFSEIIGWRIVQRFMHPDHIAESMTITEEFTLKARVRIIERTGKAKKREVFPNFLGVIPIIHWPNLEGSDEVFGRPAGEALIPTLSRYGEILDAGLNGNIRQGRPTPVIEKMGGSDVVDKFWDRYGRTETQTLPDGTTESTRVVDFDADQLLTLGGTSEFSWKAPGSFSKDTVEFLGILFYLIVQHTEIPEFVWGVAINASKASAEAQTEPFVRWVEKKRGSIEGILVKIVTVVIAYKRALNEIKAIPEKQPDVKWRRLMTEDGRLTLDTIVWAVETGLLDEEAALILMPLDIPDPKLTLALARADKKRRDKEEIDKQVALRPPPSDSQAVEPGERSRNANANRPTGKDEKPDTSDKKEEKPGDA